MTQKVREQFAELTRQALKHLINDQINERLKTALATDASAMIEKPAEALATPITPADPEDVIVTTAEELEAFYIIRSFRNPASLLMVPIIEAMAGLITSWCPWRAARTPRAWC